MCIKKAGITRLNIYAATLASQAEESRPLQRYFLDSNTKGSIKGYRFDSGFYFALYWTCRLRLATI